MVGNQKHIRHKKKKIVIQLKLQVRVKCVKFLSLGNMVALIMKR